MQAVRNDTKVTVRNEVNGYWVVLIVVAARAKWVYCSGFHGSDQCCKETYCFNRFQHVSTVRVYETKAFLV
jgi:hypothetical protein